MRLLCIVFSVETSSFACMVVCGKPMMLTPPWSTKLTKTRDRLVDLRTLPDPTPARPAALPNRTFVKVSGVTSLPL